MFLARKTPKLMVGAASGAGESCRRASDCKVGPKVVPRKIYISIIFRIIIMHMSIVVVIFTIICMLIGPKL